MGELMVFAENAGARARLFRRQQRAEGAEVQVQVCPGQAEVIGELGHPVVQCHQRPTDFLDLAFGQRAVIDLGDILERVLDKGIVIAGDNSMPTSGTRTYASMTRPLSSMSKPPGRALRDRAGSEWRVPGFVAGCCVLAIRPGRTTRLALCLPQRSRGLRS
jgi:hypothetical protein